MSQENDPPKRLLQIEITAGATTCAAKPGVFCEWLRVKKFGQVFLCGLFDRARLWDDEDLGWIQRCPECLAVDVENKPK